MDTADTARLTLTQQECITFLRSASVARIAYTDRALPAIGVVSYTVVDEELLLHTESALSPALRNAVVAFQADGLEGTSGAAWCVSCVGKVVAVPGDDTVLLLQSTMLSGWRTGPAPTTVSPGVARAS